MKTNGKLVLILIGILLISGVFIVTATNVKQNLIAYVQPVSALYNPQNTIYNNRMVGVNLSQNFYSDIFYSDNGEKFNKICRNCDEFGYKKLKRIPFDDGFHQVIFFSEFESYKLYKYVNLTIDTHKPIITGTFPSGKFTNGSFWVEFDEENPTKIFLYYGNNKIGFKYNKVNISNCYSPKRSKTRCNININMSLYDTSEIIYRFNITDILNRYGESKEKKVNVDYSAPKVNIFNYTRDSKNKNRVNFFFDIYEPNFKVINYIDYSERNPIPKLLCQSLVNNKCQKYKIFSTGYHNLTIQIIDQAGNVKEINNVIV